MDKLAAYQAETIDGPPFTGIVRRGPCMGTMRRRRLPDSSDIVGQPTGVSRMGSVASGNISDKTLNGDMIDTLIASFAPAEHKLIYVADSALVTGPEFKTTDRPGVVAYFALPRELLAEYQRQTHGERHFQFLKGRLLVDVLFVKKPERIEALGYVLLMACLLYSLVKQLLRHAHHPISSPSRRIFDAPDRP